MEQITSKKIPQGKINAVAELSKLIDTSKTILVANISSIPGSQFQQITKKIRNKATIKVPKKSLFLRAIENSKKTNLENLKNFLEKPFALLFSEIDSYDLAGDLLKNKSPAKAKPGQVAPIDLEVPAGPTNLVPGPAISELGALGIQIQIQGGKIEIKEPKVVAKSGSTINEAVAAILAKLGIMPFSIGFLPVCAYDSDEKKIYSEMIIDAEGTIEDLKFSFGKALAFAVGIGYFSNETTPLMIQKAASYERRLIKIINGEPEEISVEAPVAEEIPQGKKEENSDNTEGFASLFG